MPRNWHPLATPSSYGVLGQFFQLCRCLLPDLGDHRHRQFGHGLQLVGGGVLSSWLIVLCGQTLLALLLAELSNRMPLSGYGYQWTSRLMNPHYGFFVGWLLMLQFITGFLACAPHWVLSWVSGWGRLDGFPRFCGSHFCVI